MKTEVAKPPLSLFVGSLEKVSRRFNGFSNRLEIFDQCFCELSAVVYSDRVLHSQANQTVFFHDGIMKIAECGEDDFLVFQIVLTRLS